MGWAMNPGKIAAPLGVLLLGGCVPQGGRAPESLPPVAQAGPAEPEVANAPDAPPAWEARPVTPSATSVTASTYTVKPGDTLRAIGNLTGAGSEAIALENRLSAPFVIVPGQKLRVPGGRYHLVHSGETGIAIAQAYGLAWSDLTALNRLQEPFVLRTGQRLRLPGNAQTAPPTSADARRARAAAFTIEIGDILTGGEPALPPGRQPVAAVVTPRRTLAPTASVAAPRSFDGRFAWPAAGRLLARFGPIGKGLVNDGVDIGMPSGSPIVAAADGVVAYSDKASNGYGGLILIRHGPGWATAYGHASELLVTRGQKVKRSQVIGRSGQSGFADKPKLHFEIRRDSKPVDPLPLLPPR